MLVRSFTLYLSNGFNPSGNSPLDNPNGKFKEEEMRHKPGNWEKQKSDKIIIRDKKIYLETRKNTEGSDEGKKRVSSFMWGRNRLLFLLFP